MRPVLGVLAIVSVAGLALATAAALPPAGRAAQADIEVFAPIREAARALQAARRAKADELARRDLRLAEAYFDDAAAALDPPAGPPEAGKAVHFARLAAAQARVAETRAIEVVRGREAAGAGSQYLDAIEGDPRRILPPRPSMPEAAGEYRLRQKEAAGARAARRAAEEAVERLRTQTR